MSSSLSVIANLVALSKRTDRGPGAYMTRSAYIIRYAYMIRTAYCAGDWRSSFQFAVPPLISLGVTP